MHAKICVLLKLNLVLIVLNEKIKLKKLGSNLKFFLKRLPIVIFELRFDVSNLEDRKLLLL
tara:strand:+ start:4618 stop:4800 length:183 start_codon:yes stop_codon:yes gene_type:complete